MKRIIPTSLILVLILTLYTFACAASADQTEENAAQAALLSGCALPETESAELPFDTAETTPDAAHVSLVRGLCLWLGGATLLAAVVVVHMARQLRKDG